MSWWANFYYHILNFPIKILVKSQSIPIDPITELPLDIHKPVLYVLPYNSKADLLAMRKLCEEFGLPDPLQPFQIGDNILPRYVFIDKGPRFFHYYSPKQESVKVFHRYIELHREYPDLDVQMIPVSVMFGRAPEKEGTKHLELRLLNGIQKFFAVVLSGRNCFTRFSNAVSFRYIADNLGYDTVIAHKLARVARIHFYRQRLAATGPNLPERHGLFEHLLSSKAIEKAVDDEAKSKKISRSKAQKKALAMLDEIAANFTYRFVRVTDKILTWTWSRMYQGLKVNNAEQVRQLAQDGSEIVYVPCHRSHIDYLLLSYVLYKQGLVPPHIAAGVNLNFWPIGGILRRLGAFFIRRTFKDKLYMTVFREYLAEIFSRGYSVAYFIEGGRSRTGRLLDPKTGTLTMTIQAFLRGEVRPITIVPVYIGYEHVLEVGSYAKELRGAEKEKESLWQLIKAIPRLKRLGYGYVNFGDPISLTNYLNQAAPNWRESIDPVEPQRPAWLLPVSTNLANDIMLSLNKAAAVNAMNLCCMALLSSRQRALTREMLEEQLTCYLDLLKHVPYAHAVTLPNEDVKTLIVHAIQMNKFDIDKDKAGDIICLGREQAIFSTYYRNNVQHLLAIPSLVASIVHYCGAVQRQSLIESVLSVYPFLQAELFIYFSQDELPEYINNIIDELIAQQLVVQDERGLTVDHNHFAQVLLLAAGIGETIQRYAITFSVLHYNPDISRMELEKQSRVVAQRLSLLHGINAPEFFDKSVFAVLITTLREQGYLKDDGTVKERIAHIYALLESLLTPDVKQTIKSVSFKEMQ